MYPQETTSAPAAAVTTEKAVAYTVITTEKKAGKSTKKGREILNKLPGTTGSWYLCWYKYVCFFHFIK